jgi:hypothetical protein
MQKVALMHNSVKNNECDVTYVLKEHDVSHCSVDVAAITELCIRLCIGLVPPVPHYPAITNQC